MKKRLGCAVICLMLLVLCGCGKSQAVKELEEGIQSMGEVTADSKEILSDLRAAYDALSQKEKEAVDEELLAQLETAYDDLMAEQIISEIQNAKLLSIDEAYEIVFSHETKNEELLQLQQDIADLSLCDGTFYQDGKYKSELVIYLQYGEYWFELDYKGYTGNVSENKLERDGENGFLFKASTPGSHINYFTGTLDTTYFTLRFAEKKLFVSWAFSEYYLDREG